MHQNIGSVYLDAPARPSRRAEAEKTHGNRAKLARLVLFVGLVALTLSGLIAGIQALVLNPDPLMAAYEETIDDPTARAELEREIASGIEEGLVGPELVAVAAAFDLDVAAEAEKISLVVLDDPVVREELRALVAEIHHRFVVETIDTTIDLAPLTAAVIDVIETESPRLATIIPSNTTLWEVENDFLPHLAAPASRLDQALLITLIFTLLIPLAVALHPVRHLMAAWTGRWVLTLGILCALAAVALPFIAGSLTGLSAVEIAVRAISIKLLAPAALTGIVGVGLVSSAAVLKHRENRITSDEGAAAAMGGFNEPPMIDTASSHTLDLPSRGLIDVNHPLTNI